MKTIIHVITPNAGTNIRNLDDVQALIRPDLEMRHCMIDQGPASVESEFDEALCIPDTIKKSIEAEKGGANAIIIDCMGDPGLDACREVVSIPVLGPCQTAMHTASLLADSFAVVTVLDRLRPLFDNMAAKYGIKSKYASFRAVDIPVLDICHDGKKVNEALTEKAIEAVKEDHASAIILGCTGFLGCAEEIRRGLLEVGLDVPIIDPIPLAVHIADCLVKTGLSHSKKTYPQPRAKNIIGYDIGNFNGEGAIKCE